MKYAGLSVFLMALLIVSAFENGAYAAPKLGRESVGTAPKAESAGRGLIFAPMRKNFVITPETPAAAIENIAAIQNAEAVLDWGAMFPPRSLLKQVAEAGLNVNLMLPTEFTAQHLSRLEELRNYNVSFRVSKSALNEQFIGRAQALGPRTKRFEMAMSDMDAAAAAMLKKVPRCEFLLRVSDAGEINAAKLAVLRSLGAPLEIMLPASFPAAQIKLFKGLKRTRLLLEAGGGVIDNAQARELNALGDIEGGAWLHGLMKKDEAFSYMMISDLRAVYFYMHEWSMTPEFIRMMNSHGEAL